MAFSRHANNALDSLRPHASLRSSFLSTPDALTNFSGLSKCCAILRKASSVVVVVAAGAYSKDLASQCGDVLPLDTERGYHVEFDVDEFPISRAVCYSPGGFIVSPMEDRRTNRKFIRAAGLIELGGLDAPPTARAFDDLEASARALFKPGALPRRRDRRDWLGFRPTLPDYVPVIGRASANENVIYAFGHQHVGLTLAAITGRLVGELAAGRTPSVNLDAYSPRRFRDAWWWRGT